MTLPALPSTDATSWVRPQTSVYSLDDWLSISGQVVPEEDSERWVSYNISDLYPDWQSQAHCQGVGVAYYFGEDDEQPTMSIRQVRDATKLCDVCPVFRECLTWALVEHEEYGVWAGTSGRVRRRIFKMVDNGEVSVDKVVEDFSHGRGDTYRFPGKSQAASTVSTIIQGALGRAVGEGDPGLRDASGREAAI